MSTRTHIAALAASLLVCSCTTAAQARRLALEDDAVIERELDTLYQCGVDSAVERELTIGRSDPFARVYVTQWQLEGSERWRLTYLVRVHPQFGPGADAVVTREAWRGDGTPDPSAPTLVDREVEEGWTRTGSTPPDDALASALTGAVAECWSERSPSAH